MTEKRLTKQRIIAFVIITCGLLMIGYPWISNWLYSNSVNSSVKVYEKQAEETNTEKIQRILQEAKEYNDKLYDSKVALTDPFIDTGDSEADDISYNKTLSLDDSGLMCFVEIPKINIYLPVYHGTGESLQRGAGHLEGTALPIGGVGNRPIISAHTGINTSKMFSDLTELEVGDLFFIHVLDKTLAYRVCDINIILPEETNTLVADRDRDLVSLLTCTPYGINTHRLVVTGERTEYSEQIESEAAEEKTDTGSSQWMSSYKKAIVIGILTVCVIAICIVIVRKIRETKYRGVKNVERESTTKSQ